MRAPILPRIYPSPGVFWVLGAALILTVTAAPRSAATSDPARIRHEIQSGAYVDALDHAVAHLRDRLQTSGPDAPETLEALRLVGTALREMGDLELADGVWRFYLAIARRTLDPCDARIAEAVYQLGATAKGVSSNYDDILPHYLEARSSLDASSPGEQELLGRILASEAHYYRYRDKARSITRFKEAIALLESCGPGGRVECADTRTWLGWTMLHMGRHEEARVVLERARDEFIALGLPRHALIGTIESALADLDALAGRWSAAEDGYRRAIELFAGARGAGSSRFAEFPLHGYNLMALTQLKQGHAEKAWESLQAYRSPAGKRLASLRGWKAKSPESYREIQDVRREVVEHRSLRRCRQGGATLDWPTVLEELDANARLFKLEAEYYALDDGSHATLRELQARLGDDCAYVGWLDSRVGDDLLCSTGPILDSRWMYVVRSRGPVRWVPLWEHTETVPREQMRSSASRYARMRDRAAIWALRVDDDPEMSRLARELAAQEFTKALPYLQGVTRIVVEFFDDQTGVRPFESLLIGDDYVGDRFAISYSPSADVFVDACSRDRAAPSTPNVVAVGDAVFARGAQTPSVAGGGISLTHHRSAIELTHHRAATNGEPWALDGLPRLPFAGAELDKIQSIYPAAIVLRGADATESKVRELFAGAGSSGIDIVHVATHALSETPLRQRCSLALSRIDVDSTPINDGLLDALEIQLAWDLDADLVVLSGCQTASGPGWFRGEPMGLATALLGVGARSVLASLWKVDDLATARLMGRFYENVSGTYSEPRCGRTAEALPKAIALAEAKRWLREYADAEGRRPFAHPVYWSGFILIGAPD